MLEKIKNFILEMKGDLTAIYFEKGYEPFKKPVLYAIPFLLVAYALLYLPSVKRLEAKRYEYAKLKASSEFYGRYSAARSKVREYESKLPALKDKDGWLDYILGKSAKKCKILIDSMSGQEEREEGNLIMASRAISVKNDYFTVGKWISDMENSDVFLKITDFNLKKDTSKMGRIKVELTVTTVFSKYMP